MPTTVDQLRRRKAQNPAQFEQERRAMLAFSQTLYSLGMRLNIDSDDEMKIRRSLEQYSKALQNAALDPSVPENRDRIDEALDTLEGFGRFLAGPDEQGSNRNVYNFLVLDYQANQNGALNNSINAFNSYCGFGLNTDRLEDDEAYVPSAAENAERTQNLQPWRDRRRAEREAAQRTGQANQNVQPRVNNQPQPNNQAQVNNQPQEQVRNRQQAVNRAVPGPQRRQPQRQPRRQPAQNNIQQQYDLRRSLERFRDERLETVRQPGLSQDLKKLYLAEITAYQRELQYVRSSAIPVDTDRVNRDIQTVLNGGALAVAERQGKLDDLAQMTPERLNTYILNMEQEVGRCAEGTENDPARARNIFEQMNRTWRIRSDSRAYRDAKQAMQDIAGLENVSQTDNYLASESMKAYIQKNLNWASSTVGKTRMACSLAFLKQTMSEDDFRFYCNNLNALRHIPNQISGNGIEYDKANPRCIVPEEIGTIREVYQAARERISISAQNDEKPSARDLAMMTALKTLERKNRNRGGANLVVEHEALQEEIEKVMRDPRFINAYQNRPNDELWEIGFGGNVDTLQGYADPLTQDQQNRVDAARNAADARERQQMRDRLQEKQQAWENREKEIIEGRRKVIRDAQEKELHEQERIRQEQEEAHFLSIHKPASELYKGMIPDVLKLKDAAKPEQEAEGSENLVDNVFSELERKKEPKDSDHLVEDVFNMLDENYVPGKSREEVIATMIALSDLKKNEKINPKYKDKMLSTTKLNTLTIDLKNDPVVKEMAKDPKIQEAINRTYLESQKQKGTEEIKNQIYSVHLSDMLRNKYNALVIRKKQEAALTVSDGYKDKKVKTDAIFHQDVGMNYKKAAVLAAEMVALREIEKKGKGTNAHLDLKAFKARRDELLKDPIFTKIGQTLTSPALHREMEKTIMMKADREHAFAEMVEEMYKTATAERDRKQDGPKNEPQKEGLKQENPKQDNLKQGEPKNDILKFQ